MKSLKRYAIGFLTALLVVGCICGSVSAWSGSGTSSDPLILTTNADLQQLGSQIASYASSYIELGADITCSGTQTPIGNSSNMFMGHFDGKNHTITGMTISGGTSQYQGMFGYCTGGFSIKNLKLVNCSVTGGSNTGMLIGYVYGGNGASVSNVETDGCKVNSSSNYVGGIVGYGAYSSSGAVTYSDLYVHDGYVVASSYHVGGIVGLGAFSSSTVTYSGCGVYNTTVWTTYSSTSSGSVGGICGYVYSGCTVKINNCTVDKCTIYAPNCTYVGGIIGQPSGTVTIQYPTVTNSTIYGNSTKGVGGMVGSSS